jgi:hypothetical protein
MRKKDEKEYINFEFNCAGICHAARGEGRNNRVLLSLDEYKNIRRHSTVERGIFDEKEGIFEWELNVAIPFEVMGLDPDNLPDKIKGNFYKCADGTANPHYVTWSPINLPSPDYHCPGFFGDIFF